MKLKRLYLLSLLPLLLVAAGDLKGQAGKRSGGDIAVVAHPDTPVDNLKLAEVRSIFRGERQYWTKDIPVVLIIRAPVARERQIILNKIFQMTDSQFKQYWVAKIFRQDTATSPKIVYSNDTAGQIIAAVPGAIAVMDANDVRPGMKVVSVDGLKPGDAGYPLR